MKLNSREGEWAGTYSHGCLAWAGSGLAVPASQPVTLNRHALDSNKLEALSPSFHGNQTSQWWMVLIDWQKTPGVLALSPPPTPLKSFAYTWNWEALSTILLILPWCWIFYLVIENSLSLSKKGEMSKSLLGAPSSIISSGFFLKFILLVIKQWLTRLWDKKGTHTLLQSRFTIHLLCNSGQES